MSHDRPGHRLMQGFPPPPEAQVTIANWRSHPWNEWSFRNVRRLLPTAAISRGSAPVWHLPRDTQDLGRIVYDDAGVRTTLADALRRLHTDGLCVLHRGRIVWESYDHGLEADGLHIWLSVTKSMVSLLVGILAGRGALDPEAPVIDVLPEAKGSAWETARIRHLLDMNADVAFDEDYADTTGLFARYMASLGARPAAPLGMEPGLWRFLVTLQGGGRHGEAFHYVSPNTDLLGWIVERATGTDLSTLIAREIWSKLGAESEACMILDPLGAPRATGGLNSTLRDMARVGQMVLDHGMADGRSVVPGRWLDDILAAPSTASWLAGEWANDPPYTSYRSQWYQLDHGRGWAGVGVHGQYLYIERAAQVVIAKFASHPDAATNPVDESNFRAFRAICRELSGA